MVWIYILKLEQNKYYVGKTNNPNFRIQDHINENGSSWTKKYKPVKLLELIPNCDSHDEDAYTRRYMDIYGVDNVRGGAFVQIILDENTLTFLRKMSISTNNKCFKCGQSGHFIKSCPNKNINDNDNDNDNINDNDDCLRCGRDHQTSSCYAKKDINGNLIYDSSHNDECLRCGRGHQTSSCYAKKDINGNLIYDELCKNSNSANYISKRDREFQKSRELQDLEFQKSRELQDLEFQKSQEEMLIAIELARQNNECSRCKRIGHYRVTCYETCDKYGNQIDSCIIS